MQAGRLEATKPILIVGALIAAAAAVAGATVVTDAGDLQGLGIEAVDETALSRMLKLA